MEGQCGTGRADARFSARREADLQTRRLTLIGLLVVSAGTLVCLAAVVYLAGVSYLVSPAYWRLDIWDREAVQLLERYGHRYQITKAGVELITVPRPEARVTFFDFRGEEILGIGPQHWYELCRWLPKGLAEDWCRRLSGAGVTYLSRGDRLFIWGPELKKCRRLLGRELREQWVFLLDEPDAAELARYVDELDGEGIEARVSHTELCVRREARIDAAEIIGLHPLSDAYSDQVSSVRNVVEDPGKLEEFKAFLEDRGFEFLEYPGPGRPRGLYIRGVETFPYSQDNEIRKAVSAKVNQLLEEPDDRSVTDSP